MKVAKRKCPRGCACNSCEGRGGGNNRGGGQRNRQSNWDPAGSQAPDVGTVADTDHVVSFKTGGPSGEETLIADGDYSDDNKGFRRNPDGSKAHDHYGPSGNTNRGKYTGPGH